MKIFAWRAFHGCIPCHVILTNKHITRCQTEAKDIKHALFSCNRAKEVWTSLGVWGHIDRMLMMDRLGSVIVQEIIRDGGEVRELKLG